jgi:hypothetical protein
MGLIFLVIIGAVIIALAWGAAVVLTRVASNIHDRVNPNANNPDAFEADLDPEGDEPEGY